MRVLVRGRWFEVCTYNLNDGQANTLCKALGYRGFAQFKKPGGRRVSKEPKVYLNANCRGKDKKMIVIPISTCIACTREFT